MALRAGAERMPSIERRYILRKLDPPAEQSNVQVDVMTKRQRKRYNEQYDMEFWGPN
jgi:hypothetical protein